MIKALLISQEDWVAPSEVAGEVLALQQGDPDACAALLARYKNRLYRYLLRWVREPATADDLFQQTWIRVIKNIRRFDAKRNFDAWLFAVARNLSIDHLRRYRPESLEEPRGEGGTLSDRLPLPGLGPLDQVLRSEQAVRVKMALDSQPPVYREVLSLRFEEEMKLEEIAEVLAIPLSTVKSRLGRALQHMRATYLRQQMEGERS